MGKTKPERSPESVAKATKSMAKKLVRINFFLTRFFWEQTLKLGANVLKFNMGKTKPERSP